MKVLYKLPAPSSADLDEALVVGRGVCTLSFALDVDRFTRGAIDFLGVVSHCTWFDGISVELIGAYDKLVEIESSEWLSECRRHLRYTSEELHHFRIYFDDGPCFEFICSAVRLPVESPKK